LAITDFGKPFAVYNASNRNIIVLAVITVDKSRKTANNGTNAECGGRWLAKLQEFGSGLDVLI
jgi:hypothetical protein